jgi:hypothetical protein
MARKFSKKTIIAITLLLVFGAIIALSIYQSRTEPYTLEGYLDVTAAIEPYANDRVLGNGTSIIIHAIVVTVKAVQGDAHGVVVQSFANSEPISFGDIPKGTEKRDYMIFPSGTHITKENGQFLVTLRILSQEVTGEVTVDIG